MVVALVLARLLAPSDWGLAAMVLVFSGFVVVFTDNAFGTALIQRRKLYKGDRSTVFWISAGGRSRPRCSRGSPSSSLLADFYGEPDVRPLFVGGLGRASSSARWERRRWRLLVRDMRFRRLELRQIAATLVGATTGITLAVKGYGAWAIVGQQLAEATTSTVLLWCVTPWRPSLRFSMASLRRLGGFAGIVFGGEPSVPGGPQPAASWSWAASSAPAAVGAFALATNVILLPFSRIAGAAAAGVLPGLLAHARRPRADGRRLDRGDTAGRRARDAVPRRAS